jgi:ABC-type dipeptide/oligopeptide/nickel transport system permease subunit
VSRLVRPALAGISVDTLDVRSCIEPLAAAKKTTVTTALPQADIAPNRRARSTQIARELVRRPLAIFGLLIILIIVVAAIGAPLLAPFPPDEQLFDGLTLEGAPLPPNSTYLLGTDLLGRDLLSRLLYGAQTSLLVGLVANGAAVAIGSLVGVTAGFLGGFVGSTLMRFTDAAAGNDRHRARASSEAANR